MGGALSVTPAEETSVMATLITVFFGGVISALVTLFLGQPLQHYFWRRQRLAERQLATLDEFNKVTAQLLHYCYMDYDTGAAEHRAPKGDPNEPALLALSILQAQVKSLFSISTIEAAEELVDQLVALGDSVPDKPWPQAVGPVAMARVKALRALYQEIGIHPMLPRTRQLWARMRLRRSCTHQTPSDP
jgi:hypothetical protein